MRAEREVDARGEKESKVQPIRSARAGELARRDDGWELAGEWPYFDQTEQPQERRFAIEPAAEKDGVPKTLLDSRAMMGWEYVCSMDKGAFYVWRSVGTNAAPPRPRELAGSWCDKLLTRHLRNWWLGILAIFIVYALWGAYTFRNAEMPLWQTLTDGNAQWTICGSIRTSSRQC